MLLFFLLFTFVYIKQSQFILFQLTFTCQPYCCHCSFLLRGLIFALLLEDFVFTAQDIIIRHFYAVVSCHSIDIIFQFLCSFTLLVMIDQVLAMHLNELFCEFLAALFGLHLVQFIILHCGMK